MTNISTFEGRYKLSDIIANKLKGLFYDEEVELIKFGFESISGSNEALNEFIQSSESRKDFASMIVKFAPDFILLNKTKQEVYFIEIKVSLTPLCLETNRMQMKKINGDFPNISNIADMDRDAFNAYKNLFPKTIIVEGCIYNPKLFECQFIENIECLRCFEKYREAFDCSKCPVKDKKVFESSRNYMSSGSQTPHMNYSLHNFVEFKEFFKSLGIKVNEENLKEIRNELMNCSIKFPYSIYFETRKDIINKLRNEGCFWLKN